MKCPNCGKELKEEKELSTEDKKVYKVYVIGEDLDKKYCPDCTDKEK